MDRDEKRKKLIELLLDESGGSIGPIPADELAQRRLLRALLNVRPPKPASAELLRLQDEYLQELLHDKKVTDVAELAPVQSDIYLWQGDITALRCDGIVNAANSQLLGCFCPNHNCIDNAIHTYAGMQLRAECAKLMTEQEHDEPAGTAKITAAYNLPCKYVLHTVGPIVFGDLTARHELLLANCYKSCLALADANGLESIAFCCISTGEFMFPNERAAQIAIETVATYKRETASAIKVIFDVFKDVDYEIYARLLNAN